MLPMPRACVLCAPHRRHHKKHVPPVVSVFSQSLMILHCIVWPAGAWNTLLGAYSPNLLLGRRQKPCAPQAHRKKKQMPTYRPMRNVRNRYGETQMLKHMSLLQCMAPISTSIKTTFAGNFFFCSRHYVLWGCPERNLKFCPSFESIGHFEGFTGISWLKFTNTHGKTQGWYCQAGHPTTCWHSTKFWPLFSPSVLYRYNCLRMKVFLPNKIQNHVSI